jgi:hypothetical protein
MSLEKRFFAPAVYYMQAASDEIELCTQMPLKMKILIFRQRTSFKNVHIL